MELMAMMGPVLTALVVVSALTGLTTSLCMAHTWKHWRQVKWYILILILGNWLELFFDTAVRLKGEYAHYSQLTDASCKFLMMMGHLGANLASMAVAALAIHTLLTAITGCQGNRLRHGLVIGLFVLLSLPMPFTRIAMFEVRTYGSNSQYCTYIGNEYTAVDVICISTSLLFFPASVWLGSILPSTVITLRKRKGNTKGDECLSDVVITGLLGVVLLACCLPVNIYEVHIFSGHLYRTLDQNMWAGFSYLNLSRNFISAIVIVVFAYVNAFRCRRDGDFAPVTDSSARGERQKLVN